MTKHPMTKLWAVTLKPSATDPTTSPAFQLLMKEILTLCYSFSGTTHGAHAYWRDINVPEHMVMITGYPDKAINIEADKEFVKQGYLAKTSEFMEHRQLIQVDVPIGELPVKSKVMFVEITDEDAKVKLKEEMSTKDGGGGGEEIFSTQGDVLEGGISVKKVLVTFTGREKIGLERRKGKRGGYEMCLEKVVG